MTLPVIRGSGDALHVSEVAARYDRLVALDQAELDAGTVAEHRRTGVVERIERNRQRALEAHAALRLHRGW